MEHEGKHKPRFWKLSFIAIASAFWILYRTGLKPSRIQYPCQQTAIANINAFILAIHTKLSIGISSKFKHPLVVGVLLLSSFFIAANPESLSVNLFQSSEDDYTPVPLVLENKTAVNPETASNLFFVQNVTGLNGNMDSAVSKLLTLMENQGLHFFKTVSTPSG